jgi:histidinol dehydrogenase
MAKCQAFGGNTMKTVTYDKLDWGRFSYKPLEELDVVKKVMQAVKERGDEAVKEYILEFDWEEIDQLEVSKEEIKNAYYKVEPEVLDALRDAADNIRAFSESQFVQFRDVEVEKDGVTIGQKLVPLERVGCYVPGGRYPLPSTALMSVIPAKMAGVKEVIICSPHLQPIIMVAADIAGADRIFKIGGIQAIAAMAYGTESVPQVDKIIGPGNKYVTAAKREVYGMVGIDFIAGPSEVMVIADEQGGDAVRIAADLLAQAEHDPDAGVYVVTDSKKFGNQVIKEVKKQLKDLPTKEIAEQSVANGLVILAKDMEQAVEIANRAAPEHLEVQVRDPQEFIPKLKNYGSLFIGSFSGEVFGDYCSGTNHILPTNRAARYTGGLSVLDFFKVLTYQELSPEGAEKLAKTAAVLAKVEGLEAHARAAEKRM